jgi:outer membrane protein TolC
MKNNRQKLIKYLFLITIFTLTGASDRLYSQDPGKIETLQFRQIWERIKTNSPSQKAALSETEAAVISKNRYSRHWLPVIYADAKAYTTNDPAVTFMSNMGQRGVTQNDFIPDNLNNPERSNYQKGTLGLDLPLYEGGSKSEGAKAMEKMAEAKKYQSSSVYLNEFSSAASAYGQIIVLMKISEELKSMSGRVDAVLANYQGSLRSNPVEYSGILSLRTLQNRIKVHMAENESRTSVLRAYLEKMSGNTLAEGWLLQKEDVTEFAENYLKAENLTAEGSFNVKAYQAMAESSSNRAEAEKSIFLPKIGIFAETNIYNGKRDTADSYTAGFYIRMNIFSPMDYGAVKQAELESDAYKHRAKDAKLKGEIELNRLYTFADVLKKNIALMKENTTLMNELVRNSQRLFSNGSIKSFQLVDVFSRKTDLIINLAGAEEEYLSVMAGIYNYSTEVSQGAEHEAE